MNEQNYIFGYGSLINKESRAATGQTGEAIPVRVKGIERSWNTLGLKGNAVVLGAIMNASAACNGVLVPVLDSELPRFDARESKYNRISIRKKDIMPLSDVPVPDGIIWVYMNKETNEPSKETPLWQSYIDVVLTGCLFFGEEFTREFVVSTYCWSTDWLDDRKHPRYERAMSEVPLQQTIDRLLRENAPGAFYSRIKVVAAPVKAEKFFWFRLGWLKALGSFLFTVS